MNDEKSIIERINRRAEEWGKPLQFCQKWKDFEKAHPEWQDEFERFYEAVPMIIDGCTIPGTDEGDSDVVIPEEFQCLGGESWACWLRCPLFVDKPMRGEMVPLEDGSGKYWKLFLPETPKEGIKLCPECEVCPFREECPDRDEVIFA